jgi:predicted ATP-dependent serine protease
MRSADQQATEWTGVTKEGSLFALNSEEKPENEKRSPYQPTGDTPIGYLKAGIRQEDIVLGNGFLERGSACLLAGPSGIGKSSIALQSGCCWSCGVEAFNLPPHGHSAS